MNINHWKKCTFLTNRSNCLEICQLKITAPSLLLTCHWWLYKYQELPYHLHYSKHSSRLEFHYTHLNCKIYEQQLQIHYINFAPTLPLNRSVMRLRSTLAQNIVTCAPKIIFNLYAYVHTHVLSKRVTLWGSNNETRDYHSANIVVLPFMSLKGNGSSWKCFLYVRYLLKRGEKYS